MLNLNRISLYSFVIHTVGKCTNLFSSHPFMRKISKTALLSFNREEWLWIAAIIIFVENQIRFPEVESLRKSDAVFNSVLATPATIRLLSCISLLSSLEIHLSYRRIAVEVFLLNIIVQALDLEGNTFQLREGRGFFKVCYGPNQIWCF